MLIPLPSIISAYWESAPKKHKDTVRKKYKEAAKAQKDLVDAIFKPLDAYMENLWRAELYNCGWKSEVGGVKWDLRDFEVELVNSFGMRCAPQTIDEIQRGKVTYCRPGTYKAIRLRSPSMESFRYTTMRPQDLRELVEEVDIELTQEKAVNNNDTLTVSLPLVIHKAGQEFLAGDIIFKWEVKS